MSTTLEKETPQKTSIRELWYAITAPKNVREDAPLKQRELVRRGKVASVILLVIILLVILPIPTAIGNPFLLSTLLVVIALDCFCLFFLNRKGMITIAGVLVVIGIEVGLGVSALTYPGGFGPSNLPLFDLLVQGEIVAVAMLPAWTVIVVAALDAMFIVFVLAFSHVTTSELAHLVASDPGRIIVQPITLLVAVAAIVIVLVNSANSAIHRADRAEEIAALERREIERQQQEIEQKQQIDTGIQQILQTHVQVANGNFAARAPLGRENVLWQIAYSLNNLLARLQSYGQMATHYQQLQEENYHLHTSLQRNASAQRELQRTQEAAARLLELLKQSKDGTISPSALKSGTAIDAIATQLSASRDSLPTIEQRRTLPPYSPIPRRYQDKAN